MRPSASLFPLSPERPRSRLAPTPSGLLHEGNALAFILTWAWVRSLGGELSLRIDDIDRERFREAYLEDIFRSLDWLGLDYDFGPQSPDEFHRQYSQHLRLEAYQNLLDDLAERGLVYACRASRRELQAQAGHWPYREKGLALNSPDAAWRLCTAGLPPVNFCDWQAGLVELDLEASLGDPVLRRRDGLPAYHLASLYEDLAQGINLVVRGQDLLASTALQVFLAQSLERPQFAQALFWHHPLVLDEQGQKLSKSTGAFALQTWRQESRSPSPIFARAAQILGLPAQIHSAQTLLEALIRT